MLATLAAAAVLQVPYPSELLGQWGAETLELIRRDFFLPDKLLYAEEVAAAQERRQVAFNWGVGVMLSALSAAAAHDEGYKPWLAEYAAASRIYWNDKGPVPGYDVLPAPKPVDRYYDDNAWMALALTEAHQILGERRLRTWARQTLDYVLSGWDSKLGGGIYWRESDRASKNTCSNAPAAAACLALYRVTREPKLLTQAILIYNWTKRTLQDPSDGLFFDSIDLTGKVDKTKWSYNTGLMIRSAAELYALTKNRQYLDDLKRMQSASAKRWLGETLNDEGRFAHLLLDSWLVQRRLAPVPNPNQRAADHRAIMGPLAKLRDLRSRHGYYGKRFDAAPPADQARFALIDQASAARAFFSAAGYFKRLGY